MRYFRQDIILKHLHSRDKNSSLLVYDGSGVYYTTPLMFNNGIHTCSHCGYMQPVEKLKCEYCEADIDRVIKGDISTPIKLTDPKFLKLEPGKTKRIKKYTYQ